MSSAAGSGRNLPYLLLLGALIAAAAVASARPHLAGAPLTAAHLSGAQAGPSPYQPMMRAAVAHHQRRSPIAARRAADDSRPLPRQAAPEPEVVLGKFKAPAPEQVHRQRVPTAAAGAAQTMRASFRVADPSDSADESKLKVVHGINGGSTGEPGKRYVSRTVGAKMQVSDEGLNYPPSKLSADIYGNVAEIVTAPPEAVESDFLMNSSKLFGNRRRAAA